MDNLQFYPTPPDLARRAWAKFKNRNFDRVLEPHAGNGDLVNGYSNGYSSRQIVIDCCEIDITKHVVLREKGHAVVGFDFLKFSSGDIYSHIIMNPPFNDGVKHLLKAWNIMWDGEIVAIVNAETVRNPFSKERQHLVDLILQHGTVEFIEGAFQTDETERETSVDIALVYLRKQANASEDIIGPILDGLKADEGGANYYREAQEVALPASEIENLVAAFNAAVTAMKDAIVKEARAQYYTNLLGRSLAVRNGDSEENPANFTVDYVRKTTGKRYDDLKDRAWASVLRGANFTSRLSSAAQRRLESEFGNIKQLEFTVQNIFSFLCGVVESQGDIQRQMACDVFDLIARYHSDNTVFYRGWKSNSKHRTAGMRIKTTRFILPVRGVSFGRSIGWETMQMLRDFDKVFAMMDGKATPEVGLEYVFDRDFESLKSGCRVNSSYFDVRFYPGIQTIHFFPRNKKLIDRFNRVVGGYRGWLPPPDKTVSDSFWLQFDRAEKFDKELREEVKKGVKNRWNNPLSQVACDDERKELAEEAIDAALAKVLENHGINVDFRIGSDDQPLMLEAADA